MTWPTADEIQTSLQQASGWEARYRLLLQWARHLTAEDLAERCNDNHVDGCEAAVWLDYTVKSDATLYFQADSESRLIRGLLVVLFAPLQNQTPATIANFDVNAWLATCQLTNQLTPSRTNGLYQITLRAQALSCSLQS
ncbi:MAG: SufE family protein [Gammaproteobacteria bacterium]|nr:SufE family protein [Gammaproteobacteria bacterium]